MFDIVWKRSVIDCYMQKQSFFILKTVHCKFPIIKRLLYTFQMYQTFILLCKYVSNFLYAFAILLNFYVLTLTPRIIYNSDLFKSNIFWRLLLLLQLQVDYL